MSEFEKISAFADGELDPSDHEQVIASLISDPEAHGLWARYHVIGDVLRGEAAAKTPSRLAGRIRESIEGEPTLIEPRKARWGVLRPVAGLAIAASVATVAVIEVQDYYKVEQKPGTPVAQDSRAVERTPTLVAADAPTVVVPTTTVRSNGVQQENYLNDPRLSSYLVNFNEQHSSFGVPGVYPYVRIVGFEVK